MTIKKLSTVCKRFYHVGKNNNHPTHKRIGLCCINIGCALYKLGRKAESHDSFQKAYDILKSLGEDDENVLLCRKYLGYF